MTVWTMVACGAAGLAAGIVACRVGKPQKLHKFLWLPPLLLVAGAAVGFIEGALSGAPIAILE